MKIDYKYTQILEDIMRYGYVYEDPNRKDVFRKELETVHIKHLVQEGFPIVTARKTFFKGAVGELLLFLKGSTDIRDYHNYGIKFWDKDTKNYEGKLSKYPISEYQKWCENNKKFIIKKQRISKFSHPVQLKTDSEVFENRNGEQYIILEKLKKGRLSYLKIQFLNGGFIKEIRNSKNKKLSVQNPYQISKLGVGCLGNVNLKDNEINKYIHSVWSNMLKRCYNKKDKKNYDRYGGKGVFVNERWLCFEYFCEDFKKYKNFSENILTLKKYHLDKDFNGGYEYSYETCNLIPKEENISGIKNVIFEFENTKTGEIVFVDNIWKFIQERSLGKSAESSFYWLLNGKLKTCKNWKCNSFSPKQYDMGKIYSYQYKKQHSVFDNFKENPLRTDLIIDSWQVDDLKDMCLIPCHYSFQIVGSDDGFLIVWNQRSTDFLLGTPINIQFYFLMGMLLELWSGHKFNGVVGNLCKVHLYDNQLKLANEMIKLPTSLYKEGVVVKLELEEDLKNLSFSEFIKKIEPSNFKIEDYDFVLNESVEMLTYKK